MILAPKAVIDPLHIFYQHSLPHAEETTHIYSTGHEEVDISLDVQSSFFDLIHLERLSIASIWILLESPHQNLPFSSTEESSRVQRGIRKEEINHK